MSEHGNEIDDIPLSGCLTIPEFYNDKVVEEIGRYAFASCINLAEVKMQAKIVSINLYAFYNWRSLVKSKSLLLLNL